MAIPTCPVWTFTGLHGVDLGGKPRIELSEGFFLSKPSPFLLSARSRYDLSGAKFHEIEMAGCFLVHEESLPVLQGPERDQKIQIYQNGLIAVQILKPARTIGVIFQGKNIAPGQFDLERTYHRARMEPGQWAVLQKFEGSLLTPIPNLIQRIQKVMRGSNAELKNAIYLLQMALEHNNPLIAGLLGVMGLEAILNSKGRWDFQSKLCKVLGNSTPVFPAWVPGAGLSTPPYTVEQVAAELYALRSKIAHGVDLREAARDPKYPVDFLKSVVLISELPPRNYSLLLSEAAIYLLSQVLQRVI